MAGRTRTFVLVLAAFAVVGALAGGAFSAVAGESPRAIKTPPPAVAADGPRTPVPKPPKAAKGTECVEPTADMRRNHMIYLDHERDQTVHQGIRGRKHSLRGCVECHAVPDSAAGGARTVVPFCADCHRYVAVRIDCFGCHATAPETRAEAASESSRRIFNGGGVRPAAPAGKSP